MENNIMIVKLFMQHLMGWVLGLAILLVLLDCITVCQSKNKRREHGGKKGN